MTIAPELLRRIVEGALLASGQPLSEDKLLSLIDEGERPEKAELKTVLEQIAENCAERGFELKQVASGWRFQVPEDLAPWVNRLWEEKPQKYSRAILETLAIIAYRQPITRGDIEEIRGVAVSSHIVKTLSERGWIKVVGQRDVPGKPSLYATTKEFLDYFNLRTLDDLPTLAEIRDIDSLNQVLNLDQQGDGVAESGQPEGAAADGDAEAAPVEAETVDTGEDGDSSDEVAVAASAPESSTDDEQAEEAQAPETEPETVAEADYADAAAEAVVDADIAGSEPEEVAEADITMNEIEADAEADFADSESEAEAEAEQPEVDASDAEQQVTLAAGLPPSNLFASDVADSIEETSTAEMATSEEAISEDVEDESREEAQVEKTTL